MSLDNPAPNWLDTGQHSRCPNCRSIDGLQVRLVTTLDLVPACLSGSSMKFGARENVSWIYRCRDCGDTGPAQMKTPEEHGRWVE